MLVFAFLLFAPSAVHAEDVSTAAIESILPAYTIAKLGDSLDDSIDKNEATERLTEHVFIDNTLCMSRERISRYTKNATPQIDLIELTVFDRTERVLYGTHGARYLFLTSQENSREHFEPTAVDVTPQSLPPNIAPTATLVGN